MQSPTRSALGHLPISVFNTNNITNIKKRPSGLPTGVNTQRVPYKMNYVLDNQDLIELITSKMDPITLCNFRSINKKVKCYSKYEFMKKALYKYKQITKKYEEHVKFQNKRIRAATSDMLTVFYETELDSFLGNLNNDHKDFNVFYEELMNDENVYEVMIINSESEDDFLRQVQLLHTDFLENFAVLINWTPLKKPSGYPKGVKNISSTYYYYKE